MKKRIYLSAPHMGGEELNFIKEAFETNWIAPLGPNVDEFEKGLKSYLHASSVAILSSGTAAIHLALILSGVTSGDEVLVSSFTFSASVNPIVYLCATPVLIDSEERTWNLSPELLEDAIKDRIKKGKKPKALIAVHLYGMPAKMDEILEITRKYEITLIEDAAEALGSKYDDKYCGTFGKFGIFSFNGNKIITTSGGGALVGDEEDIKKARFLATQARDDAPYYQHSHIGYNYRMSNVLAGIGRGQLMVLDKRVKDKRKINNRYRRLFAGVDGIEFLTEPSDKYFSNYWLTTIVIDKDKTGFSSEELRLAFAEENIESRPLWKPMHLQPVFKDMPKYVNGVSEKLFNNGICLPSGTNMSEDDWERIEFVIRKLLSGK
jgi:dTDP-4-amino-4,6-dideoxygalactose transaminase